MNEIKEKTIQKIHQAIKDHAEIKVEDIKITEGTLEHALINVYSVNEIVKYDDLITTVSPKYGDIKKKFDNINNTFNDAKPVKVVLAIHIGQDSEYEKCIIGRDKYVFDYWAIEYIYNCGDELLADMLQNPYLEELRILQEED